LKKITNEEITKIIIQKLKEEQRERHKAFWNNQNPYSKDWLK